MGSERLPGKVLYPLGRDNKPALIHLIERIKRSNVINNILIVTTQLKEDGIIGEFAERTGCQIWYGKTPYVLDNILSACSYYKVDGIVDVTADCPLIDPRHIDILGKFFLKNHGRFSYVSNITPRRYPRGFDLQIYSSLTLRIFADHIAYQDHRKHSGWNIMTRESIGKQYAFEYVKDYSHWRLCIDEYDDYRLMKIIFDHFRNNKFSCGDVIKLLERNPNLLTINDKVQQKVLGRG